MNPINVQPYRLPDDATWFITGCSNGIGRSLATLVSSQPGQKVIATARNPEALSYLDNGPNVLKLALDVDSPESVDKAFAQAASHFGVGFHIDVFVNNAGFSLSGDTENVEEGDMHAELETNFFGAVRCSIKAVENMRKHASGRGGLIYQISSVAGVCAFPGHSFYHASKWALEGWTESFAREMSPDWNINFCLVEPASVKTNFEGSSKRHIKQSEAYDDENMPSRKLTAMVQKGLKAGVGVEPLQVSQALWHVAKRGQPVPIHLPLSSTAIGLMKSYLQSRLDCLEATKEISALDKNQVRYDIN